MKLLSRLSLLLTFLPTGLMAEAEEAPKPVGDLNLLEVVTPLLMVVGLILVLAWIVKKLNRGLPGLSSGGGEIEILSSTPVSNQSRLCLIRVGGEDLLIGITNHNISLLKTFDEPVVSTSPRSNPGDFAQQFRSLLNRKNSK